MRRYAALLRGVSPTNAKMSEIKAVFLAAGFAEVKTVLSSGNVVFRGPPLGLAELERKVEAALEQHLQSAFPAVVRSIGELGELVDNDPYRGFRLSPEAKRVVTFLRRPPRNAPVLPIEQDGARILKLVGSEVFSAYLPSPKGPVFMSLIERTFGKDLTTRTFETVRKVVAAADR